MNNQEETVLKIDKKNTMTLIKLKKRKFIGLKYSLFLIKTIFYSFPKTQLGDLSNLIYNREDRKFIILLFTIVPSCYLNYYIINIFNNFPKEQGPLIEANILMQIVVWIFTDTPRMEPHEEES